MIKRFKNTLMSLNGLWETFEHKKNIALLVLFMIVVASMLEALSIGMLLPVMEIIIEGNTDSKFGSFILSMFDDLTQEKSLAIVLILFMFLVFIKNIFIYLKNKASAKLSFGLRGYWMDELMKNT